MHTKKTLEDRIAALITLIQTLRGKNGCPWDRKQTPSGMAAYLLEESYELMEAVISDNPAAVCEELGDVLFLVLFIGMMYQEKDLFSLEKSAQDIHEKMVRRHPHVFGDVTARTPGQVKANWQAIKKKEKQGSSPVAASLLDGLPSGLPPLIRAYRLSARAARTGFDWPDMQAVMDKVEEEWGEFKAEWRRIAGNGSPPPDAQSDTLDALSLELGDLLFSLVNVGRFAGLHPETALTRASSKFEARFRHMEHAAADAGKSLDALSDEELDALWESAKTKEAPNHG